MKEIIFAYLITGCIITIALFALVLTLVLFFKVEVKTNKNQSKILNVLAVVFSIIYTIVLWPSVLYMIIFNIKKKKK